MSTEAASAPAPAEATSTTKPADKAPFKVLSVMRGGLYLLEGILQRPETANTNYKVVAYAKLWSYLRRMNPCSKVGEDGVLVQFEKNIVKGKSQSDIDFEQQRVINANLYEVWLHEVIQLPVSAKQHENARAALKWAVANREKGVLPQNNDLTLSVLSAFDMDKNDEGKPLDEEE